MERSSTLCSFVCPAKLPNPMGLSPLNIKEEVFFWSNKEISLFILSFFFKLYYHMSMSDVVWSLPNALKGCICKTDFPSQRKKVGAGRDEAGRSAGRTLRPVLVKMDAALSPSKAPFNGCSAERCQIKRGAAEILERIFLVLFTSISSH